MWPTLFGGLAIRQGHAHIHTLVLWDIDGTLVDSAKLGRDAFVDGFERVTGHPPRELVPFAGRTDLEIALDMLERAGLDADDALLERFGAELERTMLDRAQELQERGRAHPGAREVLSRLRGEPGVAQSLLTGNIAPNAIVKLAAFGLDEFIDFDIGAYGSDDRQRGRLVAVAIEKCARKHGTRLEPAAAVLVGDTPLDIAAARAGGARSVGVATGPYGVEELAAVGADVVLQDLNDTDAAVHAVLNR